MDRTICFSEITHLIDFSTWDTVVIARNWDVLLSIVRDFLESLHKSGKQV